MPRDVRRNKYIEWFIYTVLMGAIPSIIRLLVFFYFEQPIIFSDFRTELFFLSIVLLVDSLKNIGVKRGWGVVSFVMLVVCIFGYAVAFFDAAHLLTSSPSKILVQRSVFVFLVCAFFLDLYSVSKK